MSDLPTKEEANHRHADSGTVRDRSTPGWVKVLGIIMLVLLVVLVVSQFFGIQHGPDLHASLVAPVQLALVAAFSAA